MNKLLWFIYQDVHVVTCIFSTFPTTGLTTMLLHYRPHSFTAHKHLS